MRLIFGCCFGLIALAVPDLHAAPAAAKANADWPCPQILVGHISPAAVWSGPSIEGVTWSQDPGIGELAAKLAARRLPIEQAKAEIDAFAKAAGEEKKTKLVQLFAAIFDKLDGERAQIISGLERFGHVQKIMADRIRAENEAMRAAPNPPAPNPATSSPAQTGAAPSGDVGKNTAAAPNPLDQLQWDLRLFEERRHTLNYVCDVPTLIEKRLFALAREIQEQID